MKTLHRIMVRLASPDFVLDRCGAIWGAYTRNAGVVNVVERRSREAHIAYTQLRHSSPAFWAYQHGAIVGVIQATGAKHAAVRQVDGGDTANRCTFRVNW